MITLTVGEFKARFSEVIERIKAGESVEVTMEERRRLLVFLKAKMRV